MKAPPVDVGHTQYQTIMSTTWITPSFSTIKTTLAGKGYLKHIKRWHGAGYHVSLIFLSLSNVTISIERVATRVSQGGHHIPTPVIQRRFKSGLALFHSHYKHIVNAWMLYDNSNDTMKLIDSGENQ